MKDVRAYEGREEEPAGGRGGNEYVLVRYATKKYAGEITGINKTDFINSTKEKFRRF